MVTDLASLPSLENVIARFGIATRKSLGQHFLLDSAITDHIVRYAGDLAAYNIIEIGPGPGGLTRSLLRAGAEKVFAIEKDERCLAALAQIQAVAGGRLVVLLDDALELKLTEAVAAPRKIVANLPYNVGTPMLVGWLGDIHASLSSSPLVGEGQGGGNPSTGKTQNAFHHHPLPNPPPPGGRESAPAYASLTLMFQKEVAERIVANPGSKHFGRLSVLAQWLCECRYDMELPPEAFSPPPKVESAVITLIPREKPLVDVSKESLETVVAKAFGQRRKMLRSALKGLAVPAETLLEAAGVDGSLRAEQLDVLTLCRMARHYEELR